MTEPRRVRTQVERDADGVAWRQTADTRPGFATYPETRPGDPSWLLRANPALGIPVNPEVLAHALDGPPPVDGETCERWCGFCHVGTGVPAPTPAPPPFPGEPDIHHGPPLRPPHLGPKPPADVSWLRSTEPRRRWWHRLTRRAL